MFHNFGDFGQSYIDHFQSRNVWVTGSKATARTSAVLSSEQIVPVEELERTEFYADWMRPQKLKHGISCLLHAGQQCSYHLGIIRGPEFGAFAEAEREALALIRRLPDLRQRRALMMRYIGGMPYPTIAEKLSYVNRKCSGTAGGGLNC